jgi:hypothetical protein
MMPGELCKEEVLTLGICSWSPCVSEAFTYEGHGEVWTEKKLAPRYIGPFPILGRCGDMAYKLGLPSSLARVHDIFHVSQLKKCLKAPVDVVLPDVAPLKADLTYPEHPVKILDQKDRITRCKTIKFFKVQLSSHTEEEATLESEDFLHSRHPNFALP